MGSMAPLAFTILTSLAVCAQPSDGPAAFEVASIKPSAPGSRFDIRPDPGGRFTARSLTVKLLVGLAYDVRDYQISGGPDWTNTEKFDIVARADHDVSRQELRMMLRTLLADRFQLQIRQDTRAMSVYSLGLAKNGPKLQEADPATRRSGIRASGSQMIGAPATMAQLARALEDSLSRPVLDNTNLQGKYDFKLEWSPTNNAMRFPGDDGNIGSDAQGPSLFTALQEQLGLKLVREKGSGTFLVIQRVERPSEN
jgi:bla regulator protein blaR1